MYTAVHMQTARVYLNNKLCALALVGASERLYSYIRVFRDVIIRHIMGVRVLL